MHVKEEENVFQKNQKNRRLFSIPKTETDPDRKPTFAQKTDPDPDRSQKVNPAGLYTSIIEIYGDFCSSKGGSRGSVLTIWCSGA
jgi:hypothetical protein